MQRPHLSFCGYVGVYALHYLVLSVSWEDDTDQLRHKNSWSTREMEHGYAINYTSGVTVKNWLDRVKDS